MRAVVSSTDDTTLPFCSFYNEDTDSWESGGLVIESVTEVSQTGSGAVDLLVSCASFHLSDFSVTPTEVEPVFQPVSLVSNVLNGTTEASSEFTRASTFFAGRSEALCYSYRHVSTRRQRKTD